MGTSWGTPTTHHSSNSYMPIALQRRAGHVQICAWLHFDSNLRHAPKQRPAVRRSSSPPRLADEHSRPHALGRSAATYAVRTGIPPRFAILQPYGGTTDRRPHSIDRDHTCRHESRNPDDNFLSLPLDGLLSLTWQQHALHLRGDQEDAPPREHPLVLTHMVRCDVGDFMHDSTGRGTLLLRQLESCMRNSGTHRITSPKAHCT